MEKIRLMQATKIYRGPMVIPIHVAEAVRESPGLVGTEVTTHVTRKLVGRYADSQGTYRFRCMIPSSRQMVGEIVLTRDGHVRVHCWSCATLGDYPEPEEIVQRNLWKILDIQG
jgi:hypothetical protein